MLPIGEGTTADAFLACSQFSANRAEFPDQYDSSRRIPVRGAVHLKTLRPMMSLYPDAKVKAAKRVFPGFCANRARVI